MSKGDSSSQSLGMLDVGAVITSLAALLYIAGWSFAYHYFGRFHLGLIGLDIPKEYLFLYSFWVIRDQIILSAVCIVTVFILYTLYKHGFHWKNSGNLIGKAKPSKDADSGHGLRQTAGVILLAFLILAVFWIFYSLGDRAAGSLYDTQVAEDFPSYPRVRVWVTDDARNEAGTIADRWGDGCFRLLLRNKENLYIFESAGIRDKVPTEIIPTRLVRLVRILPQYHRCGE